MIGEKFGKLTVLDTFIKRTGKKTRGYCTCRCDCGKILEVWIYSLKRGQTSCGCIYKKNEEGKRFNKLLVIEKTFCKNGYQYYLCLCDCGKKITTSGYRLRKGSTKSCGCLRLDNMKKIGSSFKGIKHINWNFDKTNEERYQKRNYHEYHIWRKLVYTRDNYKCQMCDKNSNGDIIAHHIKNYYKYDELRTDVNNGITLCKKCHKQFHKIYGNRDNNLDQLNEFKEKYNGLYS